MDLTRQLYVSESCSQFAVKNDPTYGKFFKMLGMGVPKQALRMKMTAEGVDPDVIEYTK